MAKGIGLSEELHAYVVEHGTPPDAVLERLTKRTRDVIGPLAVLQIALVGAAAPLEVEGEETEQYRDERGLGRFRERTQGVGCQLSVASCQLPVSRKQ